MLNGSLASNKLDELYFHRKILFTNYVDAFDEPPHTLEGAMMVPMFKWELKENPNKLKDFFEHYGLFVMRALKINGKNNVLRITSQHLGGFAILADWDKTGNITIKTMGERALFVGNPDKNLIGVYNHLKYYRETMNIFSDFIGKKGKNLTSFLMGRKLL